MDFTPEVEYEVIREAVSHKLDRPLVYPSNKLLRDSTQTKTPNSPFHIGHNNMVELVGINTNYPDSNKYSIYLLIGNTNIVTYEFLKSSNVPDIGSIKFTSKYYINNSKNLTQEKNENILFPEFLSHLQQEFRYWNYNLSHLHPKSLFKLENLRSLQSIFIHLKYDVPICES